MPLDIRDLWDFGDPEGTERRMLAALATASAEDAFILQTQIARTYGIRRDFERARQILDALGASAAELGVRVRAYYQLELGRAHVSATHDAENVTHADREVAQTAYMRAYELAVEGGLDGLAIDALHMMTFVDRAPQDQVKWNQRAIQLLDTSSQEDAKRWEGSLRNNLGYALHLEGSFERALAEFQLALAARQREGDPKKIRIAYWMIAWTLRALGKLQEALEIQLRLERECLEAEDEDPYVYEELEILCRELGDARRAQHYAGKKQALERSP